MSAITGRGEPLTISFSASAASRSGTAGRTISQPASFNSWIWRSVALTSRVSVLVMVCTAMGAAPPMTPPPTLTGSELRRDRGDSDGAGQPIRAEQAALDLAGDELIDALDDVADGHHGEANPIGDGGRDGADSARHPDPDLTGRGRVRRANRCDCHGEGLPVRVNAREYQRRAMMRVLLIQDLTGHVHRFPVDRANAVSLLEAGLAPAPIETSITRTLNSLATTKWPASWGPIRIRNAPATAMTDTTPLSSWFTTSDYRRVPAELILTNSRAHRSAARISSRVVPPPGKACSAASTVRMMPVKGISRARNAFTASSLAALSTAGRPLPAWAAPLASRTAGKRASSRG